MKKKTKRVVTEHRLGRDDLTIIVDGNNSAYRSAFALQLTNIAGGSVAVPYGVLQSVRAMLERFTPANFIVVWDGGRSEIRKALCPEYKNTVQRAKHKTELGGKALFDSIELTQELLTLLGIQQIKLPKIEADDVICGLIHKFTPAIIVSTDKDFYQLISKDVNIYNPIKDVDIFPGNIGEVSGTGFTPEQYLEYHIILGDKSDNIPGIEGLGKKTAQEIIQKYGTIINAVESMNRTNTDSNRARRLIQPSSADILNTNRLLIDLRTFIVENKKHLNDAKNILELEPKSRYKTFDKRIMKKDLGFASIHKELNYWLMPFRKMAVRRGLK